MRSLQEVIGMPVHLAGHDVVMRITRSRMRIRTSVDAGRYEVKEPNIGGD